jgi:hypothetical protein
MEEGAAGIAFMVAATVNRLAEVHVVVLFFA